MPVWHRATRDLVRQGKLVVLGITQEQHADRCRLFAQWQGFDWPILHDPINLMEAIAVPKVVAIDEYGIVRLTRPRPETLRRDFIEKQFTSDRDRRPRAAVAVDLGRLHEVAKSDNTASAWRAYGDGLAVWGTGEKDVQQAIAAYRMVVNRAPKDGRGHFRLGVCLRRRYESSRRQAGDFQAAIDHWSAALAIDPNQYIWRRRIEQYGPRSIKPYPFYDWVEGAMGEIRSRGEKPVELRVAPSGAELARPRKRFSKAAGEEKSPDPKGRIARDLRQMISAEVTVVPKRVAPGQSVRVHVVLRPNTQRRAHWNNESKPLRLWIEADNGLLVDRRRLTSRSPSPELPLRAESDETRHLEFEAVVPRDAMGRQKLTAYALYYVCNDVDGTCQFLRQDLAIEIEVRKP